MNASKVIILKMLLLWPLFTFSQQFWTLTNEFWGGPKTSITLVDDSVLFVGTTSGILKSTDDGNRFEKVLSASSVYSLFSTSQEKILAGGNVKNNFSEDLGITWDSVALNSVFPVNNFIENEEKTLLATTLNFNEGDGVFYSEDIGSTWENRSNGIGSLLGCEKIATDKNGRLYLMISDKQSTGNGGLFISENNGLLWKKISINLDSINGPVKITHTTGLSISPDDSLYLSFYGVATNYLVQLNICKSIDDVPLNNSWKLCNVDKTAKWWEDKPLNNIHFSQNGDLYSSYTETVNYGATYYLKAKDKNWNSIDYGLGTSKDGWRHEQIFAEKKSGRIFMVQYLDERIYTTDKSLVTDINPPKRNPVSIQVYPNPVKASDKLSVQIPKTSGYIEVSIYDLTGKKISMNSISDNTFKITGQVKSGTYILAVKYQDTVFTEKILIN